MPAFENYSSKKRMWGEIRAEAVVCPHCGCPVVNTPSSKAGKASLAHTFGILALALFAPLDIPAIILANVSKNETGGVMNKVARTGAICGFIALILWSVVFTIIVFL